MHVLCSCLPPLCNGKSDMLDAIRDPNIIHIPILCTNLPVLILPVRKFTLKVKWLRQTNVSGSLRQNPQSQATRCTSQPAFTNFNSKICLVRDRRFPSLITLARKGVEVPFINLPAIPPAGQPHFFNFKERQSRISSNFPPLLLWITARSL